VCSPKTSPFGADGADAAAAAAAVGAAVGAAVWVAVWAEDGAATAVPEDVEVVVEIE